MSGRGRGYFPPAFSNRLLSSSTSSRVTSIPLSEYATVDTSRMARTPRFRATTPEAARTSTISFWYYSFVLSTRFLVAVRR